MNFPSLTHGQPTFKIGFLLPARLIQLIIYGRTAVKTDCQQDPGQD